MDHSTLWLWLPDALLVLSIAALKWVLLASTCKWVHTGLLRASCTLIDCLYWLSICYRLYLGDVTSGILYFTAGLAILYYLVQPELTVQLDAAPADLDAHPAVAKPLDRSRGRSAGRVRSPPQSPPAERTTSRRQSRVRSSQSSDFPATIPTPTNPPLRPSIKFGNYTWRRAQSTLTSLFIILYLRTSYTPEALTALENCLNHPFYGSWSDCVAPIFRHECPVYYTTEALDMAKECLELRDMQWTPLPIDVCLQPLYAHPFPAEGSRQSSSPHGQARDPCQIKLHGLSGSFPWPQSTLPNEILNIPKNTPQKGLRKAYQDAMRQWHPDKGGKLLEKESLECITRHINDAYEKLDGRGRGGRFW